MENQYFSLLITKFIILKDHKILKSNQLILPVLFIIAISSFMQNTALMYFLKGISYEWKTY